jgi:hypothetical protein
VSRPGLALPWEKTPVPHCIEGWEYLRAGLNTEAAGGGVCRGSNPGRRVCSQTLYYADLSSPTLLFKEIRLRSFV